MWIQPGTELTLAQIREFWRMQRERIGIVDEIPDVDVTPLDSEIKSVDEPVSEAKPAVQKRSRK